MGILPMIEDVAHGSSGDAFSAVRYVELNSVRARLVARGRPFSGRESDRRSFLAGGINAGDLERFRRNTCTGNNLPQRRREAETQ